MVEISEVESARIERSDLAKLAIGANDNYPPFQKWLATLFLNVLLSLLDGLDLLPKTANSFGREINLPPLAYPSDSMIEQLRFLRSFAPLFNMPIELHNAVARTLGLPKIVYLDQILDVIMLKLADTRQ